MNTRHLYDYYGWQPKDGDYINSEDFKNEENLIIRISKK